MLYSITIRSYKKTTMTNSLSLMYSSKFSKITHFDGLYVSNLKNPDPWLTGVDFKDFTWHEGYPCILFVQWRSTDTWFPVYLFMSSISQKIQNFPTPSFFTLPLHLESKWFLFTIALNSVFQASVHICRVTNRKIKVVSK